MLSFVFNKRRGNYLADCTSFNLKKKTYQRISLARWYWLDILWSCNNEEKQSPTFARSILFTVVCFLKLGLIKLLLGLRQSKINAFKSCERFLITFTNLVKLSNLALLVSCTTNHTNERFSFEFRFCCKQQDSLTSWHLWFTSIIQEMTEMFQDCRN